MAVSKANKDCIDKVKMPKEMRQYIIDQRAVNTNMPVAESDLLTALDLQNKTLDQLHDLYHQNGVAGYEKPITKSVRKIVPAATAKPEKQDDKKPVSKSPDKTGQAKPTAAAAVPDIDQGTGSYTGRQLPSKITADMVEELPKYPTYFWVQNGEYDDKRVLRFWGYLNESEGYKDDDFDSELWYGENPDGELDEHEYFSILREPTYKHIKKDFGKEAADAWLAGQNAGQEVAKNENEEIFPEPENPVNYVTDLRKEDTLPIEEAEDIVDQWKALAKTIGEKENNEKKVIISLFDYTGNWPNPYHDAGYTVLHFDIQHAPSGKFSGKKPKDLDEDGEDAPDAPGHVPMKDIFGQLEDGNRKAFIGMDLWKGYPQNLLDLKTELEARGYTVEGVLAAPPCTSFAGSGARWWADQHDGGPGSNVIDQVLARYGQEILRRFDSPLEFNKFLVDVTEEWFRVMNPTHFHAMENPRGRIKSEMELPNPNMIFNPNNFGDPYTKETMMWGVFNNQLPTANTDPTGGSKIHKLSSTQKIERSTTPEGFAYAFFVANNSSPISLEDVPTVPDPDELTSIVSEADITKQLGLKDNKGMLLRVTPEVKVNGVNTYVSAMEDDGEIVYWVHYKGQKDGQAFTSYDKAIKKYNEKVNKDEKAKPPRSTEAIVTSAETVISQAEEAKTEEEVDAAVENIETALNEVESKIGKLTESWSTEEIEHERPSVVIGKQVKKEITKYAKSIAKQLGWEITAKNIYDNIAPAGGEVVFRFDIPGTPYQMYVTAEYAPEDDSNGIEHYNFDGFFYRLEEPGAKGQAQYKGSNQWQHQNVTAKEMAQILQAEAKRYIGKAEPTVKKPTVKKTEVTVEPETTTVKTETVTAPAPAPIKQVQRKVRDEKLKAEIDALADEFLKNDGTFSSGGLSSEKIEKGTKLIGLYLKGGFYKFSDIIEDLYARYGDKIKPYFEAFKQVYGGYFNSEATDEEAEKMDGNLRKFTYEGIIKNIEDGTANTGSGDADTASVGQNANTVDEGRSSTDVQGNEGEGDVESVGSGESGSSVGDDRTTGDTEQITSEPSGGNSEGETVVPVTGNEEINHDLGGESKDQEIPEPVEETPVVVPLQHNGNFIIPPDFTHSKTFNVAQNLQNNIDAIKILIVLEKENRRATYEEQQALFKYVGWGGIKEIGYDPNSSKGWVTSNEKLKPKIQEVLDLLKELDENYYEENLEGMQRSTANAHYTAIPVIRGMYNIIRAAGFKSGKIVEPSGGTGNFIGAMPFDMMEKSQIAALEKDHITSLVLKHLYPNITSKHTGYEKIHVGENVVDLTISNIPFGTYHVMDPNLVYSKDKVFKKSQNKIHSYFFARAIHDAKPNGLIAFITSTGILDSGENSDVRKLIGERAEFLGALRIPNDAFKGNANTSVTTDIIFLRKFGLDEEPDQRHNFQKSKKVTVKHKNKADNFTVQYNEYFHDNPDMILGQVAAGGMYGASKDGENDAMTVMPTGIDLEQRMTELAERIAGNVAYDNTQEANAKGASELAVHNTEQRPGNIVKVADGVFGILTDDYAKNEDLDRRANEIGINPDNIRADQLYTEDYDKLKEAGLSVNDFKKNRVEPIRVAKKYQAAVPDLMDLGVALNQLYAAEYGDLGEDVIEAKRAALNKAYQKFLRNNGSLYENKMLVELDGDGANILALENVEDKKITGLADIFRKRVFQPMTRAESAGDIAEAISLNLSETGTLDLERLAELLKVTPEEVITLGKGIIFKNPLGGFETKDKYLSGNVRAKLEQAQLAAQSDNFYLQNVEALQAVQPADLAASQIYAPISAPWIDGKYIAQFASQLLKQNVLINKLSTGRVNVSGTVNNTEVTDIYGSGKKDAFDLLEEAIQNRMPQVTYLDDDGRVRVDEKATQKAIEKAEKIKKAFRDWIWLDDDRRNDLVTYYNRHFNNTVVRKRDGSHLIFEGYAGKHEPRAHQRDGAWMIIQEMGGILDHIVGSGKSLLMALAANKMKRMGLIKKPIMIGLKANAADLAKAYRTSFPLGKVLYPKPKDFTPENRRAFFAKMANNDWDLIVMTHDQFGMIEQSKEIQQEIISNEIELLENDIRAALDNDMSKRDLTNLIKRKENLEAKLATLAAMRKDPFLKSFEEMGIDFMFVDESQQFKNLQYSTIQKGVAGLGDPKGSGKAFNLLFAIRTLQKRWGGDKGTVFASGTPISNTMVEMFLLFKYLRPNKMAELGLSSFDQWANTFAAVNSEIEFGVTNSLKPKTRMRDFMNVPEMSVMYREVADVRNDSNLVLPKPKFKQTYRLKTEKEIASGEIVTIGDRKFKSIGKLKGLEKNEYYVSLMSIGPDDKLPKSGEIQYEGGVVPYSDVTMSDGLLVNIPITPAQRKFAKKIQRFAETKDGAHVGMPNLSEKKKKAHMLLATNLAAKMAIDMRLINPANPSSEVGKLGVAANTILDHYKESDSKKGVQLVFSDLGTPKGANNAENLYNLLESRGVDADTMETIFGEGARAEKPTYPRIKVLKERIMDILEYSEDDYQEALIEANEDTFNVYQELKNKLISRGIPANEIAFIHDYKNDKNKEELFEAVKAGRIRVVIGSTAKLGTGVNVQDKIVAMHHLDVPWRPSDMEQRNGRGIRQGNKIIEESYNNELPIYYYATEATLDAYKYQLLDTKQKFIDQGKSGEGEGREISEGEGDEENGVSYAAMVAMLSGNPVLLEKAKIDKIVKELENSERAFDQDKYTLKDKIASSLRNANYERKLNEEYKKDKVLFDSNSERNEKTGELLYKATVGEEEFTERKKAGERLLEIKKDFLSDYIDKYPHSVRTKDKDRHSLPDMERKIGEIAGFDIVIRMNALPASGNVSLESSITVKSPLTDRRYAWTYSDDAVSLGGHLQREIRDLQSDVDRTEGKADLYEKDAKEKQQYLESLPAEFPRKKELADALIRQQKVQAALEEMTRITLPTADVLEAEGERLRSTGEILRLVINGDADDIYAVAEDDDVFKIENRDDLAAALEDEGVRFYRYTREGEKPDRENVSGHSFETVLVNNATPGQLARLSSFSQAMFKKPLSELTEKEKQTLVQFYQYAPQERIEGDARFSAKEAYSEFETKDKTPVTVDLLEERYPDAIVVQSQTDLPQAIQDVAAEMNYTVEGVLHDGKVYLVADNLDDMGRAEGVYRHEKIGHRDVINHLAGKIDSFARALVDNATPGQLARLNMFSQSLFGKPVSELSAKEKSVLGQEYIAKAAENPQSSPTTWAKVTAFVRDLLRDFGIKLAISDNDIKVLLQRAEAQKIKKSIPGTFLSAINNAIEAFYSPLERFIQRNPQKIFSPEQVLGQVKNLPQAEIEAVGLRDFLEGKTKVTKEELLEYVRDNKVNVETVVKGGTGTETTSASRMGEIRHTLSTAGWELTHGMDGEMEIEHNGEYVEDPENEMPPELYALTQEAWEIEQEHGRDGDEEGTVDGTQYSNWTLPGEKSNYREVLMTIPNRPVDLSKQEKQLEDFKGFLNEKYGDYYKGSMLTDSEVAKLQSLKSAARPPDKREFRTGHFSEPNIVAHARLTDRVTADGKKILLVEESQSDWAREGRKRGFQGKPYTVFNGTTAKPIIGFDTKQEAIDYIDKNEVKGEFWDYTDPAHGVTMGVPDMPFKNDKWVELVTKKVIQIAANEGYDGIAWINGEQTKDRYDLSKTIDSLEIRPTGYEGQYLIRGTKDGRVVLDRGDVSENKIADYVGKDIAEKAIAGKKEFHGLDLKVGGKWANNLYDKQIPKLVDKYSKLYGGNQKKFTIDTGRKESEHVTQIPIFDTQAEEDDYREKIFASNFSEQNGIEITPEMRDSTASLPLFSSKQMRDNLNAAREAAQSTNIADDLKKYADDFINYVQVTNPNATAEDVIKELENERGKEFNESERPGLYEYVRASFEEKAATEPAKPKGKKAKLTDMVNSIGQNNGDVVSEGVMHRRDTGAVIGVSDVVQADKLILGLMAEDAQTILDTMKAQYQGNYLNEALKWLQTADKNKVSLEKRLAFGIAIENEINYFREGLKENVHNIPRKELSRIYAESQRINVLNSREGSKALNTTKTLYDYFANTAAQEGLITRDQAKQRDKILETLNDDSKLDDAADQHEQAKKQPKPPKPPKPPKVPKQRKQAKKPVSTKSELNDILKNLKDELDKLDC